MSDLGRRLARLETVWSQPMAQRPTDPPLIEWEDYLSTPCWPLVLRRFCEQRAGRRYRAEGHSEHDWWGLYQRGLTEDERRMRTRAELTSLESLRALLGPDAGWAAWHAEAEAWPADPWPLDEAAYHRHLAHDRGCKDTHREREANWRLRWPEWHPGMTAEEHDAFEGLLMREAEARW